VRKTPAISMPRTHAAPHAVYNKRPKVFTNQRPGSRLFALHMQPTIDQPCRLAWIALCRLRCEPRTDGQASPLPQRRSLACLPTTASCPPLVQPRSPTPCHACGRLACSGYRSGHSSFAPRARSTLPPMRATSSLLDQRQSRLGQSQDRPALCVSQRRCSCLTLEGRRQASRGSS
jgi:hypothetical protein